MKMLHKHAILIILSAVFAISGIETMAADLVAHWPLDQNSGEEVKDVAGKNPGKIVGGKANWVPGKFGNGLELKGPNHYVQVEKTGALELKNVTLIVWVNFKALGGRQEVVSYADSYGIFAEGTIFKALLFDGGAWAVVNGVTTIKQDNWYQVAQTVTDNEIRLYVNGRLDAKIATPAIKYQNFPMWFGGGPADNQFWLTGVLDEIEIWNDDLTDAEIEKLFASPPVLGAVDPADKLAITWGDVKSK